MSRLQTLWCAKHFRKESPATKKKKGGIFLVGGGDGSMEKAIGTAECLLHIMGRRKNGRYVVADVINNRLNAADVQNTIKNTAIVDKAKYRHVRIRINQDPGQAGKAQAEQYMKLLSGFSVSIERETGSKETRAEPFSAQWLGVSGSEKGNVDIFIAPWNEEYLSQLENFPEGKFKDMTDASGTAFHELMKFGNTSVPPSGMGEATRDSPWKLHK